MKKLSLFLVAFMLATAVLSCSGDTVYITMSPKSYDFGDVRYGETGTNDFIFTNKYKVDITITTIEITGVNESQFTITVGNTPGTIVPGNKETHTVTVAFMPEGGDAEAIMNVNYNDKDGNPKTIEVKLEGGCIPAPLFVSNVTGHDFGIVNIGNYVDHTVTITNNGIEDLNITDVQLNSVDFKVESGWTGAAEVIAPGSDHNINVRFEPTATGTLQATLAIAHDATNETSPFEITLDGEGADPKITTNIPGTTPEIDLGGIFKDVTASSAKFEISNTGTGDLTISNMQFTGSDFTLTSGWSGTPISISSGNMVEFEVTFTPGSTGNKAEFLAISHNASNEVSPYEVSVKGEATDNYTPVTFTKNMTPISGGTPVYLGDDDYTSVPIGFTFNFYGKTYTQAYVCSNGFIGFGSTADYDWGEDNYPLPQATSSNNCIYLFNLDLDPSYGGTVSYKLEGSGTDHVFIVEFSNVPDYNGTGYFSGQIKIFETSNIIELHFSSTSMAWTTVSWSENIIGLEDEYGSKGVDWDGVNSNPANTAPNDNIRYK